MSYTNWQRVLLITSVISLGLLIAPSNIVGLALTVLFSAVVAVLLWRDGLKLQKGSFFHKCLLIYAHEMILMLMLCQLFYSRWIASSKLEHLTTLMHLPKSGFLMGAALILGVFSIWVIDFFAMLLIQWLADLVPAKQSFVKIKKILIIASICLFQLYFLGFSSIVYMDRIIFVPLFAFFANYGFVLLLNIFIFILSRKWKRALTITSVLLFLWSVANYYTIQFHGSPLFFSEFYNIGTAATVAMNYKYRITGVIIVLVLMLIGQLIIIHRYTKCLDEVLFSQKKGLWYSVTFAGIILLFSLSSVITIHQFQIWRPWDQSIENSGFFFSSIIDLSQRANPVVKPDGYSEIQVTGLYPPLSDNTDAQIEDGDYPDIILILNETLYDLQVYSDIVTDVDPFYSMRSIEGASAGYAVTPNVGGGTNNSEYELLTSNSMYLLKNYAPFTYLSTEQIERNSIMNLKQLGYSTVGMHCGYSTAYSRQTGYPALGFDTVILGPTAFQYVKSNGNRPWLDSENYRDMLDWYEKNGTSHRFAYLLTFQNHGGFEQNDASLDTVHVQNDFGNLTDDLDEYLSSLELSAKAFRKLTEYYAESDRKVIICMVGDHAPSFITSLPPKSGMSFEEAEITKRLVPYVIWSNYGAEIPSYSKYASMVDLLPMVMEAAGLPLPPFYRYILDLHEDYPVRTANGLYMDAEGNYGTISDSPEASERMALYYNMEYNSLKMDGSYRSELFEVR